MGSAQSFVRNFLPHPADIPIEIDGDGPLCQAGRQLKNVGPGGLACRCERPLRGGADVLLTIALIRPPFRASGLVGWCRRAGRDDEVGIRFAQSSDPSAARVVGQICQIEHYRREVLHGEGRVLDAEAAAREWFERFAVQFPMLK